MLMYQRYHHRLSAGEAATHNLPTREEEEEQEETTPEQKSLSLTCSSFVCLMQVDTLPTSAYPSIVSFDLIQFIRR